MNYLSSAMSDSKDLSISVTDGLDVGARDGVSDSTVEGENVEFVGTSVKAVGSTSGRW